MSKIRLCINGDRTCDDYKFLLEALDNFGIKPEDVKEVVSGKAQGGDYLGEVWAKQNKIKIKEFPADWDDLSHSDALIKTNKFGKQYDAKSGFRRNQQIAEYADVLVALQPNYDTSGTQDCIEKFKKLGKTVHIHRSKNEKTEGKYKF